MRLATVKTPMNKDVSKEMIEMTSKKLIILFVLTVITAGCIQSSDFQDFITGADACQTIPVDIDNGNIHLTGNAQIDKDDNIISYNIIGYIDFIDEKKFHAVGKIVLVKDRETGIETTSYDLYVDDLDNPAVQAHISGDAPLVKASVTVLGIFEENRYVKGSAFRVSYTADTGFQITPQGSGFGSKWL